MRKLRRSALGLLSGAVLLAAGSQSAAAAEPLPNADGLQPGLAVCYINGMIRHIDEMEGWESQGTCRPGPPLANLDSKAGKGKVLTSRFSDGVMAVIAGYIHLDRKGQYAFVFASNDGVRLEIGGKRILQDPDVHSDRFSDTGYFDVKTPGWYPIAVRYFERKNTSTLRFFWGAPDEEGTMPIVPPEALAHKPANG